MGVTTDDVTIGYVGGGSRHWARTLMTDLAQQSALDGTVRLYDIDHESARQNARLGTLLQRHADAHSEWTYTAVETLAEALTGGTHSPGFATEWLYEDGSGEMSSTDTSMSRKALIGAIMGCSARFSCRSTLGKFSV
jgi:hypothetical protein